MKAGIAAMIMAAKVLRLENIQLDGTLSLSFVPDEEKDGPAGTRFLIESGMISADFCIVGEPTGGVDLCYGHKGSLWLEITTYGRPAHGSRPWKGINAFTQMVEVVKEIDRSIKPSLLHQEGVDISDQVAGMTGTLSLGGVISSGASLNVVPSSCTMTVDRRLAPGESPTQVLDNFHSILRGLEKRSSDFKADMRILSQYPACVTSADSLIIGALQNTLLDITGVKPELFLMLGGCDMRFFHSRGIPTVIYGPGVRGMSHQSDEYVELDKIVTAAQVYAITALRLLGIKQVYF
jgi:succinyl-diaminopimelate desuccinylase